jgi:hypothetical protein
MGDPSRCRCALGVAASPLMARQPDDKDSQPVRFFRFACKTEGVGFLTAPLHDAF